VTVVTAQTDMGSQVPFSETISALQWPGLTSAERGQAKELLEKYHQVFAKSEGDLGCTDEIEHEIPLTDNSPVRQRYRRIPPTQWQAVKNCIKLHLESKVIRESSSPYASPIVLVQKKSGELRMCVD